MQYLSFLLFGSLIGMQHALEADHLAAVAALSQKRTSRKALVMRGSFWGLGHTLTLFLICGALLLLGESVPVRTEAALELLVGVVIVFLGVNVLISIWRQRPHVHIHAHDNGTAHVHLHAHAEDSAPHDHSAHVHGHEALGFRRALTVGMLHGAAGSAGLLVLAAAANSVVEALSFVAAFGIGSIAGMAALSFVASYPLRWLEGWAGWGTSATYAVIGVVAVVVGGDLIGASWSSF
jgi:ABC-type nickel/cobalt efflux system permease component RcnA